MDENAPSLNELDRNIANELTHLSLQERELAENDLHGINTEREEDPLLLQSDIVSMQKYLDMAKKGTVYEEAESINPDYVNDRQFRLLFLRADRYDAKEAAERMIRFFALKKELFGRERLCEPITLDDFDSDDMECLNSGYLQVSPHRDTAGRIVMIGLGKLRKSNSKRTSSRVSFYTFMAALESEEAQKVGFVCIYYLLDASNFASVTGKLRATIPVCFAGIHVCYNDITQYARAATGVYALNRQSKVRFRPHYGSHMECQYALTTFGIPQDALPVSSSGEMSIDRHLRWIETRRRIEAKRKTADVAMHGSENGHADPLHISWVSGMSSPGPAAGGSILIQTNDVLFGRGKTVVEHEGNLRFRKIVSMYADQYEKANRQEKTCMTEKIVQQIHAANGRFLKRDDFGDWEEVDHETARKKVAHAFRNRRKLFNGNGTYLKDPMDNFWAQR